MSVTRRLAKCLHCGHTWNRVVERPATCRKCKRPDWDEPPKPKAGAPKEPPPPCVHALTFRGEYAAFLARRAERDAQSIAEYRERRQERRYYADEVEAADVRPPLLKDGTPFVLAKMTQPKGKRRKGRTDATA